MLAHQNKKLCVLLVLAIFISYCIETTTSIKGKPTTRRVITTTRRKTTWHFVPKSTTTKSLTGYDCVAEANMHQSQVLADFYNGV